MRDTVIRTLIEEAKANKDIELITGDLGFGVLKPFYEQLPNQFTNAGIAEQSMTGIAAGMALSGKTVFTYSIGNFPTLRCVEQIRNDCAYMKANVKIICVGGGFVYGSLGMSHHATEDLAVMRAIPGVSVFAPGDPEEVEAVVPVMLRKKGTCYLRLGRGGEPKVHAQPLAGYRMPEALTLRSGRDVAILSTGGILTQAVGAAELLSGLGIEAEVLSFPCLKPLDMDTLTGLCRRFRLLVTVEEHTVIGGLGSAVCEAVAERGLGARVYRIGMNDCFSTIVGTQQYLREAYDMSADRIAERVQALLKDA